MDWPWSGINEKKKKCFGVRTSCLRCNFQHTPRSAWEPVRFGFPATFPYMQDPQVFRNLAGVLIWKFPSRHAASAWELRAGMRGCGRHESCPLSVIYTKHKNNEEVSGSAGSPFGENIYIYYRHLYVKTSKSKGFPPPPSRPLYVFPILSAHAINSNGLMGTEVEFSG